MEGSTLTSTNPQNRWRVALYAALCGAIAALIIVESPAKLLAQQALTFDAFTGGRLLMNLINGRDTIMETYGVTTSHDDRYVLGEAYWREFHRCYAAGSLSNFPNTPLAITPAREGAIPLWGAGDSAAGLAHAGKIVDGYLTMLRGIGRITSQFAAATASAARQSRHFSDLGALASVIVAASAAP